MGRVGLGRRTIRLSVHVVLGFVASAALVLPATQRAFAGPVDTPPALSARGAEALSQGGPLVPGEQRRACVTVTYTGDGDAAVLLEASVTDDGLAEHLTLEVTESAAGCAPTTDTVIAGALDDLAARPVEAFTANTPTARAYAVTLTAGEHLPSGATAALDLAWTLTR
jgi:hypothetical protein